MKNIKKIKIYLQSLRKRLFLFLSDLFGVFILAFAPVAILAFIIKIIFYFLGKT